MLIDFANDFADLLVDWQLVTHTPDTDTPWGEHQPGTANAPVTIQAVPPQPISERELVKEESGEIVRDLLKTYTSAAVNTRTGTTSADLLTYDGVSYEVYQLDHRVELGNYRKVLIRKIQGDR